MDEMHRCAEAMPRFRFSTWSCIGKRSDKDPNTVHCTMVEVEIYLFSHLFYYFIFLSYPKINAMYRTGLNFFLYRIRYIRSLCDNICQTKSLAGHLAKLVDIYLEMGSSCICKATSFTPSQLSPLYALCLSLFYSLVFVINFHIFEPFFQFL